MNIYFDTEFWTPVGHWGIVYPISIGAIREDGKSYYAEIAEFDWDRVPEGDWLHDNVRPLLTPEWSSTAMATIREELIEFAGPKAQFWAFSAAYDWVSMCVIMDGYLNLPAGWSRTCFEIKQFMCDVDSKMTLPPQITPEHHALNDAVWNREIMWAIKNRQREIWQHAG